MLSQVAPGDQTEAALLREMESGHVEIAYWAAGILLRSAPERHGPAVVDFFARAPKPGQSDPDNGFSVLAEAVAKLDVPGADPEHA
ncbi:MAG: hypothetical protein QM820_22295 [Minicystis sp.]